MKWDTRVEEHQYHFNLSNHHQGIPNFKIETVKIEVIDLFDDENITIIDYTNHVTKTSDNDYEFIGGVYSLGSSKEYYIRFILTDGFGITLETNGEQISN